MKVELGCYAKDIVTGFKGVVISRVEYISSQPRVQIQSVGKDAEKVYPSEWFDESRIIKVGTKKITINK